MKMDLMEDKICFHCENKQNKKIKMHEMYQINVSKGKVFVQIVLETV